MFLRCTSITCDKDATAVAALDGVDHMSPVCLYHARKLAKEWAVEAWLLGSPVHKFAAGSPVHEVASAEEASA